VHCIDLQRRA